MSHRMRFLFLGLCLAVHAVFVDSSSPFGIQTNEDTASTFASSMVYDATLSRLYITGATYGREFDKSGSTTPISQNTSDCFFGILQLPVKAANTLPVWIIRQQIGRMNTQEVCSAIYTTGSGSDRKMYVLGHSVESPSVLAPLKLEGPNRRVYGMVLDLNWKGEVHGGHLIESAAVQIPIAMQFDDGDLLIASLKSASPEAQQAVQSQQSQDSTADPTNDGAYFLLQNDKPLSLSLQRLHRMGNRSVAPRLDSGRIEDGPILQTLDSEWWKEFATDQLASVQLSSMIRLNDSTTILAGSTRGTGIAFGGGFAANALDGFLMLFKSRTGNTVSSRRVSSNGMDRILGLCQAADTGFLYVTGMTDGNLLQGEAVPVPSSQPGHYQAFLHKINATTLETIWTYQIGTILVGDDTLQTPQVHGLACDVTLDDKLVYMTGIVKDGAVLTTNGVTGIVPQSAGKDDIFVVQLNTDDGSLNFALQIGTSEDDTLASGIGVLCDKDGNAMLLCNTKGSMFREKSVQPNNFVHSNIAVLSVDRLSGALASEFMQNTGAPTLVPTVAPMAPLLTVIPSSTLSSATAPAQTVNGSSSTELSSEGPSLPFVATNLPTAVPAQAITFSQRPQISPMLIPTNHPSIEARVSTNVPTRGKGSFVLESDLGRDEDEIAAINITNPTTDNAGVSTGRATSNLYIMSAIGLINIIMGSLIVILILQRRNKKKVGAEHALSSRGLQSHSTTGYSDSSLQHHFFNDSNREVEEPLYLDDGVFHDDATFLSGTTLYEIPRSFESSESRLENVDTLLRLKPAYTMATRNRDDEAFKRLKQTRTRTIELERFEPVLEANIARNGIYRPIRDPFDLSRNA